MFLQLIITGQQQQEIVLQQQQQQLLVQEQLLLLQQLVLLTNFIARFCASFVLQLFIYFVFYFPQNIDKLQFANKFYLYTVCATNGGKSSKPNTNCNKVEKAVASSIDLVFCIFILYEH